MRIALSGYYGFGNTGDEAVLDATLAGLRHRLPGVEPVVLSSNPDQTAREHGVDARPRWPLREVMRTVRECDLLLSGGGTLLQDATSLRSLWYYTQVTAVAKRCGVPYAIFAQGIGPISTWLGRRWARNCLRHAAAITVRDPASQRLALQLGGASVEVELAADPALLLEPVRTERVEQVLGRLAADRPIVGVAPRPWQRAERAFAALSEVGRLAREDWGATVVVLPFQRGEDLRVAQEVAQAISDAVVVGDALNAGELLAVVSRLDLLVGMRLHALIFAASQAVPAVGVSYDPKVASFCELAAQPCVSLTESERLPLLVTQCWEQRVERAARGADIARQLARRAQVSFDMVERLCRGAT